MHLAAHASSGRTLCGFLATAERVVVPLAVWRESAGQRCRRCEGIERLRLPVARVP
jgi:hypothetical protein